MQKIDMNMKRAGIPLAEAIYLRARTDPEKGSMTPAECLFVATLSLFTPRDTLRVNQIAAFGITALGPDATVSFLERYQVSPELYQMLNNPPDEWPDTIENETEFEGMTEEELAIFKNGLRHKITTAANRNMGRVATQNFRKIMTYTEKRREAEEYRRQIKEGVTPDPSSQSFLHLMVDVQAGEVPDLETSVTRVEAIANSWRVINSGIEQIERDTYASIAPNNVGAGEAQKLCIAAERKIVELIDKALSS